MLDTTRCVRRSPNVSAVERVAATQSLGSATMRSVSCLAA
jgi:hypothetical protein